MSKEISMSNTQNTQNTQNAQNETKARQSSAPDGTSKLPDVLPDFPGDPTKPGPSGGPIPK